MKHNMPYSADAYTPGTICRGVHLTHFGDVPPSSELGYQGGSITLIAPILVLEKSTSTHSTVIG